ncbi:hypothetical protein HG536_0G00180 [Torulaspora globosa]|uniref:Uncharacterized protein n=1 Tax=Torulaspora globosa TaxID=48254 RepID=A0A7G3ZKX5_9SACH|nr:uncharacterized protein HG536_0G00180 [Torulaspora globosa]QLL34161.1 hypothetical protein HG536_0G00180 [Torulaspora globosa]
MNADELVDFLLQDDDLTVEVRYEEPDFPFQIKEPPKGTSAASEKLRRSVKPVFTEVDEILKDLEQLIVRPSTCQAYNTLNGDAWSNTEQEATEINKDVMSRRRHPRKKDRNRHAESSGAKNALEDNVRNRVSKENAESKQENTTSRKPRKSRKRNLERDRNQNETEPFLIPRAGNSLKTSRKNEHKTVTSDKEQVDIKQRSDRDTKEDPRQHQEDYLSKKRSKKKKNRQNAAPESFLSEEVLIEEVTELLEMERTRNEHEGTKKGNAENRTRKSVSRFQAPLEGSKNHSSKKQSKKRITRQKNAEKLNNDGSTQVTAEDPKDDRLQQVGNQQKALDSKE